MLQLMVEIKSKGQAAAAAACYTEGACLSLIHEFLLCT